MDTTTVRREIVEFLIALPNVYDSQGRRALLLQAGIDAELLDQIDWGDSSKLFFPRLLDILLSYGTLPDGKHALEAVLEAAKENIGQDKRALCDGLIHDVKTVLLRKTVDVCPSVDRNEEKQEPVTGLDISETGRTRQIFGNMTHRFTTLFRSIPYRFVMIVVFIVGIWWVAYLVTQDKDTVEFSIKEIRVTDTDKNAITPIKDVYPVKLNDAITITIGFTKPADHDVRITWTAHYGEMPSDGKMPRNNEAINTYTAKEVGGDTITVLIRNQNTGERLYKSILLDITSDNSTG